MKKMVLLLSLASAPAMACNQGDLAGRWNLFVEDFSCLMTVQQSGKVNAGQCVQMGEDPDDAKSREAVRGNLKVQPDCRVTGQLNTEDRDGRDLKLKIGQSRLGQSSGVWQGVIFVGRTSSPAFNLGDDVIVSGEYARIGAVLVD